MREDQVAQYRNRVVTTIAALSSIMLVVAIAVDNNRSPQPKFKTVDNYKDCDVVRYTSEYNEYHYFLHCK